MLDCLFKNAVIITMDSDMPVISDGYVGIRSKRIEYVGDKMPNEPVKRIISGFGKLLLPGLINAHTHTAMTLLRGYSDDCNLNDWLFKYIFPAEAKLDTRAIEAGFRLGCAEMLRFGTTTICDSYFHQDSIMRLAGEIGIRGFFSNAIIALAPDFDFFNDRSIKELYAMLKTVNRQETVRPQMSIHCERTSPPEVWEKCVEIAKENGLSMHIHLSETKKDQQDCINEFGLTPTARLEKFGVFSVPTIAAHCCHLTEKDMDILAKNSVSCVHCPVSNLKLASGIADIVKMKQHGVNVALGTDGCASNNNLDLFEEIKLSALLAKNLNNSADAFSVLDALSLATINGAKAIGMENSLGKIKKGFLADLIMLDMSMPYAYPKHNISSNVVYAMSGNDVSLTMVNGKILYERGAYNSLDINQTLVEVEKYALPLLS